MTVFVNTSLKAGKAKNFTQCNFVQNGLAQKSILRHKSAKYLQIPYVVQGKEENLNAKYVFVSYWSLKKYIRTSSKLICIVRDWYPESNIQLYHSNKIFLHLTSYCLSVHTLKHQCWWNLVLLELWNSQGKLYTIHPIQNNHLCKHN